MFSEVMAKIRAFDTVIIHRHANPDGDALGSQIGLKHILRDTFPEKKVYAVGDGAGRYAFMEDSVMDVIPDDTYRGALAVILDTSSPHLISDERWRTAADTVRVDHHVFQERIAGSEAVDPSCESCCGMIASMAMEYGLKVSPLAAESLFTGMATDSGRFRYDGTTAKTFRMAAFLAEREFDMHSVWRALYTQSLEDVHLRGRFLEKIRVTPHGAGFIYTDLAEMKTLGKSDFEISRGMVNVMADIEEIRVWVNFTETGRGVVCELRSRDISIYPIAAKYGGGGHPLASGATVKNREEAMAMLADLDALAENADQKEGKRHEV